MPKRPPSTIRVEGSVAYVSLTRGFEAVIDVRDVPLVEGHAWRAALSKHGHAYAQAQIGGECVAMHRHLLDTPAGLWVDHQDGDGLNNRRSNIRNCTPTQNMANKAVERRNRLGIKGVSLERGRYRATITPNGRKVSLGVFSTPEEASAAYQGAARVLWGEFAKQ